MGIHKYWQRQGPKWIALFSVIVCILFSPLKVRHLLFRMHDNALVIRTSKTSPPRLAFHETIQRLPSSVPWYEDASGRTSSIDLNQMVASDSHLDGLKSIRYKKMVLQPMQMSREKAMQHIPDRAWIESLPPHQQDRLQEANARTRTLEQDWNLPTTRDLLEEKIKEISAQTRVSEHSKIYVAAATADGRWITPSDNRAGVGVRTRTPADTAIPNEGDDSRSRNDTVEVSGKISLSPESALGDDRTLEISWMDRGVAQENGSVDLKNGTYRIRVPGKTGTVVARVVDRNGSEVGSGKYRINQHDTTSHLRQIALHVQPRSQIVRYSKSFYDQDQKTATVFSGTKKNPDPRVLISALAEETKAAPDGTIRVDGIAEGSWSFLRTQKKGFYPGLYLVTSGEGKVLPLFPEKMMKALIQIVRDARGSGLGGESGSVIWGQVTGQAAQAKIEIEDMPEAQPVYFNDLMIPDESAKGTSKNGYFAFVDLPKGFYSIRATAGEKQLGVANVEVDDETVSLAQVRGDSLNEKRPVEVFDAFTGSAQNARVEFQSINHAVDISGYAEISLPQEESLSLVQVTPESEMYLESVQIFSSHQDHLHLPLIRKDWLAGLRAHLRISEQPLTGTILGFVPTENYELNLPHLPDDTENIHVIYFDAQGMLTEKGVAGGGFIVFNAPSGSHSVSILPATGQVVHSRIIPVDPGTLNTLKFDF